MTDANSSPVSNGRVTPRSRTRSSKPRRPEAKARAPLPKSRSRWLATRFPTLSLTGGTSIYSMVELGALAAVAVAMAGAIAGVLARATQPGPGESSVLHDFFFARTPIQWINVALFCFAGLVFTHRFSLGRLVRRTTAAIADGATSCAAPGFVKRMVERVSACRRQDGACAAASLHDEFHERVEEDAEETYGLLGHTAQLVLSLGFLGTVWSISVKFFEAFAGLSDATVGGLRTGLVEFTTALSTALDTTVLAILLALGITAVSTVARWNELGALRGLREKVRGKLGLETAAHRREAESLRLVERELPRIVDKIAARMDVALHRTIEAGTKALDAELHAVVVATLEHVDDRDRAFTESLAERVADELGTWLSHVREEHSITRIEMQTALEAIAQRMSRVPTVEIRYPEEGTLAPAAVT